MGKIRIKSILLLLIIINNSIIQCIKDCTFKEINLNEHSEEKLRKAIPVIGAVSCGKSYFLNSLLGLDDLLQTAEGGSSNFVCIIRHNPALNNPIFYHLNFKSDKTFFDEKSEYTIEEIIEGKENIKQKIKDINKSIEAKLLKNQNNIEYEKLFYMLEINITNIKNKILLEKYDFYDIPGFNKKQDNYLKNFIKYFVDKIDFGIILINAETHHTIDTQDTITKLKETIKPKNKTIENYLIILNKIDRQAEPQYTIEKTKEKLGVEMMEIFKFYNNKFIALDSRKLRHFNLMKDNFIEYFLYLLEDYIKDYVTPFKDKSTEEIDKQQRKIHTFYSFKNYLEDLILVKYQKNKEELVKNFESQNYELEKENIFSILKEKNKKENKNINYEIDEEEEEEDEDYEILKALLALFKSPQFVQPKNTEIIEVENYFDNILENIKKKEKIKKANIKKVELSKQFGILNKTYQKLEDYEKKNENLEISYIKYLSYEFKELFNIEKLIDNINILYIGIFGITSSGKSLILNDIFGDDILTVNEKECTKRGLIIEDGENIEIFKANYEIISLKEKNITIINKKEKLASGKENVKELIKSLNKKYAIETKLENDNFFIITLPILFFEKYGFDSSLRKQIKFIDLPGLFSGNKIQFNYNSILEAISCFLLIYRVEDIKSDIPYRTYQKLKSIKTINEDNKFLELCLFIINLKSENKKDDILKDQLFKIAFSGQNYTNLNSNITFFNAKSFENYLEKKKFFSDLDYYFDYLNHNFNNNIFNYIFKDKINYFYDKIKQEFKNSFTINSKDEKCSEFISNKIKSKFVYYDNELNDKKLKKFESKINKICIYLTYAKNNLNKSKYYLNSYEGTFFSDLKEKINHTFKIKPDYKEQINRTLNNIKNYLNIDKKKGKNILNKIKEDFDKSILSYEKIMNETFLRYKFDEEFDNFKNKSSQFFKNKKKDDNIKKQLKDNNNSLEKALNSTLKEFFIQTKEFQDDLNENLKKFNKDIQMLNNKINLILENVKENQEEKEGYKDPKLNDVMIEKSNLKIAGEIASGVGFSISLGGVGYAGYAIYTTVKLAELTYGALFSGVGGFFGVIAFGYLLYDSFIKDKNGEKLKQSFDKINEFINEQIDNQKNIICKKIEEIKQKFKSEQNSKILEKQLKISDFSRKAGELFENIKEEFIKLIEKLKNFDI